MAEMNVDTFMNKLYNHCPFHNWPIDWTIDIQEKKIVKIYVQSQWRVVLL